MFTPIEIFNQVVSSWNDSRWGISLAGILADYRLDTSEKPTLTALLEGSLSFGTGFTAAGGVFLKDTSGLATHILGLYLLKCYQAAGRFGYYTQVLWLPYGKLLSFDAPGAAGLKSLTSLLGEDVAYDPEKPTLLLITGIDRLDTRVTERAEFKERLTAWKVHISAAHWIAIGNFIPEGFPAARETYNICLPSLHAKMTLSAHDNGPSDTVHLRGERLVTEIAQIIQEAYPFDNIDPTSVFSLPKSALRAYITAETPLATSTELHLNHAQPLLTLQEMVKLLAGETPAAEAEKNFPTLDRPSLWYFAALSAQAAHTKNPRKKFFLYKISGHIVVRDMSEKRMHYISDLGPADTFTPTPSAGNATALTDIQWLLQHLTEREDFEKLNEKTVARALMEAKKAWQELKTTARNEALIAAGKAAIRKPVKWPKKTHEAFNALKSLLTKNATDTAISNSLNGLPEAEIGASYQHMQSQINALYSADKENHPAAERRMTQLVRDVIDGATLSFEFSILTTVLAANILSESARFPACFFSVFAMQEIMHCYEAIDGTDSWQKFLSSRARVKLNLKTANWATKILADCLDAIGGIHPMAHNGSYHQVSDKIHSEHGISWPFFKTMLLYIRWLQRTMQAYAIGNDITECTLILGAPAADMPALSKGEFLEHFHLPMRVERALKHEENMLNIRRYPFAQSAHLLADPDRIMLFPCGTKGKHGYFLRITLNTSEDRFVYLDPKGLNSIALKLDSTGKAEKATELLNYLCKRHPEALVYRYTRALNLVFHPALMTDLALRCALGSDIKFLRHSTSKAVRQHAQYIGAILLARSSLEGNLKQPLQAPESMRNIQAALHELRLIESAYAPATEEYPMIQFILSALYQKLNVQLQSMGPEVLFSSRIKRYKFFQESTVHFVNFSLSWHKNQAQTAKFLAEHAPDSFMHSGFLVYALACSTININERNCQILTKEKSIPEHLKLLRITVLALAQLYEQQSYAENGAKRLIATLPTQKRYKENNLRMRRELKKLEKTSPQVHMVTYKGKYAVILTLSTRTPTLTLSAWASFHGLKNHFDIHEALGRCLVIYAPQAATKRSAYQPLPHPDSFFTVSAPTINALNNPYFKALSFLFAKFITQVINWDPLKNTVKSVAYTLYAYKPSLPKLYACAGTKGTVDAIISPGDSLPCQLLLDWLKKHNLLWYWQNNDDLGRVVCVPAINSSKLALSNGQALKPYLSQGRTFKYSTPPSTLIQRSFPENTMNTLCLTTPVVINALSPASDRQEALKQKRLKAYKNAHATAGALDTDPPLPINKVHQDTVDDGNCVLHCFSLGVLHLQMQGLYDISTHDGIRTCFAEVFSINPALLTQERFSQLLEASLSEQINLENPLITKILEKLTHIPETAAGTDKNQLAVRIRKLRSNGFMRKEAYHNGDIKPEYKADAIRYLAKRGELYQVLLSLALKKYCAKHASDIVTVHYQGPDDIMHEATALAVNNRWGEYLDDRAVSFLATALNIRVALKTGEFRPCFIYGNTNPELTFFVVNPGALDCHYELVLDDSADFLSSELSMSVSQAEYDAAAAEEALAVSSTAEEDLPGKGERKDSEPPVPRFC